MIDPTSEDIGRTVIYRAGSGLGEATIKSFSRTYVWIIFVNDEENPTPFPARREYLEWGK
jgi:hypothetical protein